MRLQMLEMFRKQFRLGFQELRLVRSLRDVTILLDKTEYLVPRLLGRTFAHREVPPSLQLEPTNVCNANCICCSTRVSQRKKGYMPDPLFRSIIDQAAEIGVKRIHLYLHGEPLLHPQIIEMIRYTKAKKLAVHLTTNGMPLNPQKMIALLGTGLTIADHVMFSVLGNSAEVHEQIMPGVNHDRVVSNILNLVELRRRVRMSGPVVETIFYAMAENEHEQRAFHDFWRDKVDHDRAVGKISKFFANYHTSDNKQYLRRHTCSNIWERMTICWNGDVTLCCADVNGEYTFGNLQEKSISEVWTCSKMIEIKKLHQRKQFQRIPICAHCDM
jgi:radical SAM protein with 4Fe4S-binding SPASM domain